MNEQECMQARQTVDETAGLTPEQLLVAEKHIRTCAPCTIWRHQVNAITVAAKEMPLFDVPESLTQRIMGDVQNVSASKSLTIKTLVLSGVVLLAFIFVFSSDSLDTVNGAVSWLIGLVLLFGLKSLIQANAKNDARLQKQI